VVGQLWWSLRTGNGGLSGQSIDLVAAAKGRRDALRPPILLEACKHKKAGAFRPQLSWLVARIKPFSMRTDFCPYRWRSGADARTST
jgi:hypothetical protein